MNSAKEICKFAAVFLFIAVLHHFQVNGAHVAEDVPAILTAQEVCKVKSGVSEEVYAEAMKNNMDANDRNLQCYASCMFEEMHTMDSEGRIDLTPFIALLGEENKAEHSSDLLTCQEEVDDKDRCKKGMKMYECLQKIKGSKFYFV